MEVPKRTEEMFNREFNQYITRMEMCDMDLQDRFVAHIERKYGMSQKDFKIIAVHHGDFGNPSDRMYAYLADGAPETKGFSVRSVVDDGESDILCSDNLAGLFMRDELEVWIADIAREFFGEVKVFIRSFPPALPDDFNRNSSAQDLKGRETALIHVSICVTEKIGSAKEFEAATKQFFERWGDEKVNTSLSVVCLEQVAFENRARENHHEPLSEGMVITTQSRTIWPNRSVEE
ncbi:MAG: hypothetical protein FWD05_04515 [Oscillospiraceae bacterium]|nr:hypothetical protein [Oscillospiraceae bacterium]